jgi:hypothetical protein
VPTLCSVWFSGSCAFHGDPYVLMSSLHSGGSWKNGVEGSEERGDEALKGRGNEGWKGRGHLGLLRQMSAQGRVQDVLQHKRFPDALTSSVGFRELTVHAADEHP